MTKAVQGHPLHKHTLLILEKEIKEFPAFYRENFPWATVLPEMQVLKDHTIPWLRRHHVGAGLMGEHGAESIHAHLMRLANDVDTLKYIMKEHVLESAPSQTYLLKTSS